ncbi:hypothetical protein QVD17_00087 [Tagetes erecta]|uniref:DUF4218 domain-containing protein n=1 Tax=Tagetes erecta TaxID=13708 RepID=A0AAD8L783_TARER|nr:hypothetical protein QVD17_00087 [Tagetes erecta]
MEHLVIHLAHEALLGGPVQYRWMYQYERKLGMIKKRIRNKSRVEGSITREHLVNEIATYCSLYFDPTIETRHNREPRNFAPQHPSYLSGDSQLSVFVVPSKRLYKNTGKKRPMDDVELKKAHTYILLNCEEVTSYVDEFDEMAPQQYPNDPEELLRDMYFAEWFETRVNMGLLDGSTQHLLTLARKPSSYAQSHKEVHGFLQVDERFKFPTQATSSERMCLVTDSTHISDDDDDDDDVDEFEEEELEDKEDTSDDDEELVFSDHSSDEDEFEC